jgi:2'-hydroxyisoflavone reductase
MNRMAARPSEPTCGDNDAGRTLDRITRREKHVVVVIDSSEPCESRARAGPCQTASEWGDVLDACVAPSKGAASPTWVPADWLEKNGQGGEDGFPIWAPPTGDFAGFHTWSNARAVKAGLTFRPVADTVAATLAWYPGEVERRARVTKELQDAAKSKGVEPPQLPDPTQLKAGPSPAREAELLATWKAGRDKPAVS